MNKNKLLFIILLLSSYSLLSAVTDIKINGILQAVKEKWDKEVTSMREGQGAFCDYYSSQETDIAKIRSMAKAFFDDVSNDQNKGYSNYKERIRILCEYNKIACMVERDQEDFCLVQGMTYCKRLNYDLDCPLSMLNVLDALSRNCFMDWWKKVVAELNEQHGRMSRL